MAKHAEAAAGPPANGRKLLPILIVAAVLVVVGGGAAAYLLGVLGSTGHAEAASHEASPHAAAAERSKGPTPGVTVTFVDMPDVVVNLQAVAQRMHFLKLRMALEVRDETTAQAVKTLMPRILDHFQLYLRALSVDDLAGPGGMQRLKEDSGVRAWKVYTQWGPSGTGFWLDDPRVGIPMIEKARQLDAKVISP